MSIRNREEIWHEEAGILKPDEEVIGIAKIGRERFAFKPLVDRFKVTFSSFLHQIRCKWCIAVLSLLTGIIILASTVPIFPLGTLRRADNEGPIGPQLDLKMRPCRSTLTFSPQPLPRIALASFTGSGKTIRDGI
jgi:hypothetical protein